MALGGEKMEFKDIKNNANTARSITITDGIGSSNIGTGNYSTNIVANGYDTTSLDPKNVKVSAGVTVYNFTVESTGRLTILVTDDGTTTGTAIIGAEFIRCDKDGNTYGTPITTGIDGKATFNNVPYLTEGTALPVYFKQIKSDGDHDFDDNLKSITLTKAAQTTKIANPPASQKAFKVTDKNYENLPIATATLTLTD